MRFVVPSLRAHLREGYARLAMLLGLGAMALVGLLGLPFALALMFFPAAVRIPLGRQLISRSMTAYLHFLKAFCSVHIDDSALESLRADRPLIIVANHPSLLDAVILLARLPHAVCVMKGSLKRNILFGPMARLSGYLSNDDPMALIRQSCVELAAGAQILIFPEGTRTRTFPLNPLGEAAAVLAARSGVPVQALLVEYSSPYLGKAWPLFRRPELPMRITVKLGRKFAPLRDRTAFTDQLESYYRLHLKS